MSYRIKVRFRIAALALTLALSMSLIPLEANAESTEEQNKRALPQLQEQWRTQVGLNMAGEPFIGQKGVIYVPVSDGFLVAVSPDGAVKWRYPIALKRHAGNITFGEIQIQQTPDGSLYVASGGNLHVIDSEGHKKWEYETTETAFDKMFVRENGYVHISSRSAMITLNNQGEEAVRNGFTQLFQRKGADTDRFYAIFTEMKITQVNPFTTSLDSNFTELLPNGQTGAKTKFSGIGNIVDMKWDNKDNVYFLSLDRSATAQSHLYRSGSGGLQKLQTFEGEARRLELAGDGRMYVATNEGKLHALDMNGNRLWETESYPWEILIPAQDGRVLISATEYNPPARKLILLDAEGRQLASFQHDNASNQMIRVLKDKVLFSSSSGMTVLSYDLVPLGRYQSVEFPTYAATAEDGDLVIAAAQGFLVKLGEASGSPARLTGIAIEGGHILNINIGERLTIFANQMFSDGSRARIPNGATYSSSDAKIVSVDANGVVRAIGPGHAVITAASRAYTASIELFVNEKALMVRNKAAANRLWSVKAPADDGFTARRAAINEDGTLYVATSKGVLKAIGGSGNEIWSTHLGAEVYEGPVLVNGESLYVGTDHGKLVKIDPTTGKVIKTLQTGAASHGATSFDERGNIYTAFNQQRTIFANHTDVSNAQLISYDADGDKRWNISVPGHIDYPLTVAENGAIVYLVARQGITNNTENLYQIRAIQYAEKLYAIDSATGATLWQYDLGKSGSASHAPVLIESGAVIAVSGDGYVFRVNGSGQLDWKVNLKDNITAEPIVFENKIIVPTFSAVTILASDGKVVKKLDLGSVMGLQKLENGFLVWQSTGTGILRDNNFRTDNSVIKYRFDGSLLWESERFGSNMDVAASFDGNRVLAISSVNKEIALYAFVPTEPEINSVTFADMAGHWAEKEVHRLAGQGVLNGYPDGLFHPNEIVSREQFAKMLVETVSATSAAGAVAGFSDVAEDRWSAAYIKTASAGGWFNPLGYGGKFEPAKGITRMEAAIWTAGALNLPENPGNFNFKDWSKVTIAPGLVGALLPGELLTGTPDGYLLPDKIMTRAEAAVFIVRIANYVNTLS